MSKTSPDLDVIEPEPELQPFGEWFTQHAAGLPAKDAAAGLAEVVKAVEDLRKKGTLVITITVAPEGTSGRNVYVTADVAPKPPKPEAPGSIYFHGPEGSIAREDPYQRSFQGIGGAPVKEIGRDGPIRELDPETGEIRDLPGDES